MWTRSLFSRVLSPLSLLYGCFVRRWNGGFTDGSKSVTRLDVPVISVGNITVGGTGKTPLVEKLARYLSEQNIRAAVLSRGYGGHARSPLVVSDGINVLATAGAAGDEPYLMATKLKSVPVLVNRNRSVIGEMAIERYGCRVLLLDDGFQHRALARDLDIVVIDASRPWGNGWLLPAGPLREPLSALERADIIVLSRVESTADPERVRNALRQFTRNPVVEAKHVPDGWIDLKNRSVRPLKILKKERLFAFAGIGHPEAFLKTLEPLCRTVSGFLSFGDHHRYTGKDLFRIAKAAQRSGVDAVVTTEKDAVRLPSRIETEVPWYSLRIEIEFGRGEQELKNAMIQVIKRVNTRVNTPASSLAGSCSRSPGQKGMEDG